MIVAFLVSLLAGSLIVSLAIAQRFAKSLQFWPPPSVGSWQSRTLRWLFRIMVVGLLVVSALDFESVTSPMPRIYVAVPTWILGFGAAYCLSFYLGWQTAFGADHGLRTTGAFRWSRNPIYIVSFVGMIGWGLFVSSAFVWILLIVWAGFYVVAAYVEEPWLEATYGKEYLNYKRSVPRFF